MKAYKAALREDILSLLNSGISENKIFDFISTVATVLNPNDMYSLTDQQVKNVFRSIETCDVACGFGRGHQSVAICDIRGPHGTNHSNRQYGLEWDESRLKGQTYERKGKTYRLAFCDAGWY